MATQTTGVQIARSIVCSDADQGLCEGLCEGDSPVKGAALCKVFPVDDVIMFTWNNDTSVQRYTCPSLSINRLSWYRDSHYKIRRSDSLQTALSSVEISGVAVDIQETCRSWSWSYSWSLNSCSWRRNWSWNPQSHKWNWSWNSRNWSWSWNSRICISCIIWDI